LVGSRERDEHPVIDLGVEDGDVDAVGGEGVAVGIGNAADERAAEQPGDQDTQVLVAYGGGSGRADGGQDVAGADRGTDLSSGLLRLSAEEIRRYRHCRLDGPPGRNLDDLRRLVRELVDRGCESSSVKSSSPSPISAEFERALIRERQAQRIALAKVRGAYRGRKRSLTIGHAKDLRAHAAAGEPKANPAREFPRQPPDSLPVPTAGKVGNLSGPRMT
jgi:hypothetical protein